MLELKFFTYTLIYYLKKQKKIVCVEGLYFRGTPTPKH